MTTGRITNIEARANRLAETTVLLNLEINRLGNTVKVDAATAIQTEADPTMLAVNKRLLDSREAKAIASRLTALASEVKSLSLPSLFRGGVYLVSIDAVPRIEAVMARAEADLPALIDEFVDSLPQRIEEAREKLGPLFNAADYPNEAQARGAWGFSHRWLAMETPDRLKRISSTLFEKEAAKARESLQQAVAELTELLRVEFARVIEHVVEKLTPDADGKKKIFRDSTIENVKAFIDTFDLRNVTGDEELAKLVAKARSLVDGLDADDVRKDESLKGIVQGGFAQIATALDGMIVTKPKRLIKLDADI